MECDKFQPNFGRCSSARIPPSQSLSGLHPALPCHQTGVKGEIYLEPFSREVSLNNFVADNYSSQSFKILLFAMMILLFCVNSSKIRHPSEICLTRSAASTD